MRLMGLRQTDYDQSQEDLSKDNRRADVPTPTEPVHQNTAQCWGDHRRDNHHSDQSGENGGCPFASIEIADGCTSNHNTGCAAKCLNEAAKNQSHNTIGE